jgi:RNA polymerase sigma-70 factor (ECF subfamily)
MIADALDRAARDAGGRVIAALAARFRDLDLAEDAFGDACLRAADAWPREGTPRDPAAWLYRVAQRAALDRLRRRRIRERFQPEAPEPLPSAADALMEDETLIPDERLRLIFICCHPAVAIEARAALTLRLVCGLTTAEIARAFLVQEATLAQRLVRAKRKIAEAGISFEVPGPDAWPERLDAVLSTLEVAYAKAHEDAAGVGKYAGYAPEMLNITRALAEMLPGESEALSLAALVRYAEARRPARLDEDGAMIPLSEQDPAKWRRPLIEEANAFLERATALGPAAPRVLQAALHGAWCARRTLDEPPPWRRVLTLYDALLAHRDDPITRLNRAVALAEVAGVEVAQREIDALDADTMCGFLPYHAVRADFFRRLGAIAEARDAYDTALGLDPGPAERIFLLRRRVSLGASPQSP